jgi:hypothetical protein
MEAAYDGRRTAPKLAVGMILASDDNTTLIAVAALVVAGLSLAVSGATFAVGWYYQRKLTARRLVVTGNLGFVLMTDGSTGPTCMCVGVFNEGLVATTLSNVAFALKGTSDMLQPTEWYLQQPSPLPIRLEPGYTWDGYLTMADLGARQPRGTSARMRPVAIAGGRRYRPRRSWRRPWRSTWRTVSGPR